MNDDELLARADANYFESMRMLAPVLPHGEVRERAGVLVAATGLPVAFLNVAFITRPLHAATDLLREAIAYFDGRSLPFIVRVREGVDPASEAAAEALGLTYADTVPGMALHPLPKATVFAAPLKISRVEDLETLRVYGDVMAAGFGMPPELGRAFAAPGLLALPDASLYTGFVDGVPVATSALFMSSRVAGVYNVSTIEAFRRRGFGEAMTRHAVAEGAAMGCALASLQSSAMGYPIYERIGFRTVAPYRTFVRAQP